MDSLTGSVERITFFNPENGYTVLRLRPDGRRLPGLSAEGLVTVIGNLPELSAGEYLRLSGEWGNHPKHGMQFQVSVCEQALPATVAGIRRYLGSGLVKGIGPRLAERIVARFGAQTLDVIERQPERLHEVPDIGPKRVAGIAAAWQEQKQVKEIMLFLHSHAISTALAVKIYRHYGAEALDVVRTDPYRMARDISGIGFKTADRIAQALGLPFDHPSRLEAGVIYALNQASDEGHVYLPSGELTGQAAALLETPPDLIAPAVERLVSADLVQCDRTPFETAGPGQTDLRLEVRAAGEAAGVYTQDVVYLTPLFRAEVGAAERLRRLASTLPSALSVLPPAFTPLDPGLSDEQRQAVQAAFSHPLSVLTGGPGTGKTTALRALIEALEAAGRSYALASPTGRAAKRLAQATDRPASTIHRLLAYKPGEGFKVNSSAPLEVDLLVIDEASMLDLHLAYNLIRAIRPGTHLMFVGDVDQLPSVGAGDILRDVIASGAAHVTRLTRIFRQAADSGIIANAHRINTGQMPVFASQLGEGDFFLFPAETPEDAARWTLDVVTQRIPNRFGLNPLEDIQVLSPMYRGPAGVTALNESLQAALNPPRPDRPEKKLFGQTMRVGDRLMQTQNNYDKEIYNGDIGRLMHIDLVNHTLEVNFDDRPVGFDWNETDQLTLAYAISVHKAQGAEFPAVVLPIVTQHYIMLQRNLLYTAITRASRLCVLAGSRRAIGVAVRNNPVAKRHTALDWRLQRA